MQPRVTQESSILDPSIVQALWEVYDSSMSSLQADSISRVAVTREEFVEQLAAPTTIKWVAWDDDQPVGILSVDTDIRRSQWIEPAFLEARMGEELRRGSVHYLNMLSVGERYRRTSAARSLVVEMANRFRLSGETIIIDTHAANAAAIDLLAHLLSRMTPVTRTVLDVVTYTALEFPEVIDVTDTAVHRVRRRSATPVDGSVDGSVDGAVEGAGQVGEEIRG